MQILILVLIVILLAYIAYRLDTLCDYIQSHQNEVKFIHEYQKELVKEKKVNKKPTSNAGKLQQVRKNGK